MLVTKARSLSSMPRIQEQRQAGVVVHTLRVCAVNVGAGRSLGILEHSAQLTSKLQASERGYFKRRGEQQLRNNT